jgi:hypothetical protein
MVIIGEAEEDEEAIEEVIATASLGRKVRDARHTDRCGQRLSSKTNLAEPFRDRKSVV